MSDDMNGAVGLALGTAQWGMAYGIANRFGKPSEDEVARLLQKAKAAGVTILDTARSYGDSEAVIGRVIGRDPAWEIFTKLDPAAETAQAAIASLEATRTALNRPVIDGVLLHRAGQRTADHGKVWDSLRCERDSGRIKLLGISAVSPEEAWASLADPEVDCIQVACSLFDQRLSRAGFFAECHYHGRRVFVRSVFLQGAAHLNPDELPPHLMELRDSLKMVREWAAARQAQPALAFLAFAAQLPEARILLGCETAAQLDENLHHWAAALHAASDVSHLVEAMPTLPAQTLNPDQWPKPLERIIRERTP